jgi:hypothetical protein
MPKTPLRNIREKKWRFEPPTDLLGSVRHFPKWREGLSKIRLGGGHVYRGNLPVKHMVLDGRLPERVSQADIDLLLRDIDNAERLSNFQRSIKGMHLSPATMEFAPNWGVRRLPSPNNISTTIKFSPEDRHIPIMTTYAIRSPERFRMVAYGLQHSIIPPENPHEKPYKMHVVPLGLALNMTLAERLGSRHVLIPSTAYTSARKGPKGKHVRTILENEQKNSHNPQEKEYLGRLLSNWNKLSEEDIEKVFQGDCLSAVFFPRRLIDRYYHEFPRRFPHEKDSQRFRETTVDPKGTFLFHRIDTSLAEPLKPYIKETK